MLSLTAMLAALGLAASAAGGIDRVAASHGITVECPDAATFIADADSYVGDALHGGIYVYAERRMILRPDVCDELAHIGKPDRSEASVALEGFAVYIVAHELEHAGGVHDETAADCGAARHFFGVAAALGASRRLAKRMLIASAPLDGYDHAAFALCAPNLMPGAQ